MVFQIFGNDAQKILQAAQMIEEKGPDIIDINIGCSTRLCPFIPTAPTSRHHQSHLPRTDETP
jgi:hypothetical protein